MIFSEIIDILKENNYTVIPENFIFGPSNYATIYMVYRITYKGWHIHSVIPTGLITGRETTVISTKAGHMVYGKTYRFIWEIMQDLNIMRYKIDTALLFALAYRKNQDNSECHLARLPKEILLLILRQ